MENLFKPNLKKKSDSKEYFNVNLDLNYELEINKKSPNTTILHFSKRRSSVSQSKIGQVF